MRAAGEGARHEAEFHERFHADALKEIEKLINVLPIVDGVALPVLLVGTHIIAKEAMETDIAEPAFGVCLAELPLPIRPQSLVGAPSPDAKIVQAA